MQEIKDDVRSAAASGGIYYLEESNFCANPALCRLRAAYFPAGGTNDYPSLETKSKRRRKVSMERGDASIIFYKMPIKLFANFSGSASARVLINF
jgi:hypothetical protein